MTHNPYSCAECNRLGWNHTDDEPWPTAEPVLPKRRDATLLLLALLVIAVIGVIAWSAQR